MNYYYICNKYGKIAITAINKEHALKKYCGYNCMLSIPKDWYVEEITKEEYESYSNKIA